MTIQINRFEIIQHDRTDARNLKIRDHKTDNDIVHLYFDTKENSMKIAEKFVAAIEEAIENGEVDF